MSEPSGPHVYRWRRPRVLPRRRWEAAMRDCERVVGWLMRNKGLVVQFDRDEPGPPEFGRDMVMFNGRGREGKELFCVEREIERREDEPPRRGPYHESCDAGGMPYGLAVCGCLIVLRHHFTNRFIVMGDGEVGEGHWPDAWQACRTAVGYGHGLPGGFG